jgi:signal transduction histidine kinase
MSLDGGTHSGSHTYTLVAVTAAGAGRLAHAAARRQRRLAGALRALEPVLPARWRLYGVVAAGGLAAAGVGYLTAENPLAGPPHIAVAARVAIIGALLAAGVYAQTNDTRAPMGGLLTAAAFFSVVWLLNGSSDRFAFSVGVLAAGISPTVFAFLMLAHPTGRLRAQADQRLLLVGAGAAVLWTLLVITAPQPPLRTPLLGCVPHCPTNVFFLGFTVGDVLPVLKVIVVLGWTTLACGVAVRLTREGRSVPAPLQRSLTPMRVVAVANALLVAAYMLARGLGPAHPGLTNGLGTAQVEIAVMIPLAILLGLVLECLFMGQVLADFVKQLAALPRADPQALMAVALRDPSLRIAYRRPSAGTYVDASGMSVDAPEPGAQRAVTWIRRDHRPVAAVSYDAELADQAPFVEAAGAAALMRLESVQLEADLRASAADLAASRVRLVETAHAERRRIERDLHDGVQQDLVGLRLKLDMAAEAMKNEPDRGERLVAAVGRQLDDVLEALRSLARGIYPALLEERGVGEALKSAARRSPLPVAVRARGIGRYSQEVEVAVYFCCLEALQNVAKHAGAGTSVVVRLWQQEGSLHFEVRDSGAGFDGATVARGNGLVNMRDRIEAVRGEVAITSRRGQGTAVRGRVPATGCVPAA